MSSILPSSRKHGWYITGNWGDTLITALYPPNAYEKVTLGATAAVDQLGFEPAPRRGERLDGGWIGPIRQGFDPVLAFEPSQRKTRWRFAERTAAGGSISRRPVSGNRSSTRSGGRSRWLRIVLNHAQGTPAKRVR